MERELTATHWRGYAEEQFPQAAWSVDGSVVRAIATGPRVDLITRERFRDFVAVLRLAPTARRQFGSRVPRRR